MTPKTCLFVVFYISRGIIKVHFDFKKPPYWCTGLTRLEKWISVLKLEVSTNCLLTV